LLTFDPFSNPSGNYSMCIAGKSGSGKSFFMNYLLTGYLGVGGHFWVIDKGGSYTKLCEQIRGQLIAFQQVKHDLGLNPFGLMVNGSIEERSMGTNVLCKMAARDEKLSVLQSRAMEKAFDTIWEDHQHQGTPARVAKLLAENEDSRIRDLATQMYPFTEGKYSAIFERTKMVEFTNPFVLLEVSGLDELLDFRSVLLMQLIMAVNREMWVNDAILSVPKGVVIDEAHDLLCEENGFVGKFVVQSVRTIRKRKGGVIIITQGLEDYYQKFPEHGPELLANSDFLALLAHKSESLTALRRRGEIVLSEGQMAHLESVHRLGKEYSEVFLRVPNAGGTGMVGGIARIVVDPVSRWMFTTDPDEMNMINRCVQEGMNRVEACKYLSQEELKREGAKKKKKRFTKPSDTEVAA